MRDGPAVVSRLLNDAKPYPVKGLYRLSEYPDAPAIETFSTGWWTLDRAPESVLRATRRTADHERGMAGVPQAVQHGQH